MYLFTRQARLAPGRTRDAMAWAAGITEKVNQVIDPQVGLWSKVLSEGVGTLSWSCVVDDLAELETAFDKLAVDEGFIDLQDAGAVFSSGAPIDDQVAKVVYPADLSAADAGAADASSYATVVQAVVAPGHFAKGIGTGIEIATKVTELTGVQTLFLTGVTGDYGGVAWITGHADIAALQAEGDKVEADVSFVEFLDREAGGVYIAGSVEQAIYRKVM